jgi:hypothetical protein
MRLVRIASVVIGLLLLVPTLIIERENSGNDVVNLVPALPHRLQAVIGRSFLVFSVLPAAGLWACGVRRVLVAEGGDLPYLSAVGVVVGYLLPPAISMCRQVLRRRRRADRESKGIREEDLR